MFSISFLSNCGVLIWHQIIVVFAIISNQIKMFLARSESLKWIRRKFTKRNNNNPSNEHTPAKITKTHNENCENIRDLNEILVITSSLTSSATTSSNLEAFDQLPIAKSTAINSNEEKKMPMLPTSNSHQQQLVSASSMSSSASSSTAPIAREEECAEDDEECMEEMVQEENNNSNLPEESQTPLEQYGNVNLVRRSKSSRVRNYLRKCKDRWLSSVAIANGGHNAELSDTRHDPIINDEESNVGQIGVTVTNANDSETECKKVNNAIGICHRDTERHSNCTLGCVMEIEDDDIDDADGYHEDIDFGFRGTTKVTKDKAVLRNHKAKANNEINAQQQNGLEDGHPKQSIAINGVGSDHDDGREKINGNNLMDSKQIESQLASLIDTQLAGIYPVFNQTTRMVLLREARDVLTKTYDGCLTTFQCQFLCKFAEIAEMLKERHCIGVALIWCQGWPLVTPIGEVILHLGDLDHNELKPAEIYLCVKTVDANNEPQLYATWRTPTVEKSQNPNEATIPIIEEHKLKATTTTNDSSSPPESGSSLRSCQLDYQDNTLYLSALTLEMLNDDLPQLLQSLLIGVEHNLERLTLNQVSLTTSNNFEANENCGKRINEDSEASLQQQQQQNGIIGTIKSHQPNSPKCGLRRSELITKNKLHNNKYMLRRFTNRQDSMNSTSSGNSSASGLSTTSSSSSNDSASYGKTLVTNGNGKTVSYETNNENETKSSESNTSPALPRFCLGTTFPHIDSDEENAEDRRNSVTDEQLESGITAPNLITDLPEKLLLSGIYLPGTRDVKGNPLITVDAESVVTAGLNCYEIATLLLYYSTIPERSVQNNNKNVSNFIENVELSKSPQRSSNNAITSNAIQSAATTKATASEIKSTTTTATNACSPINDNIPQSQKQQEQQKNEHAAQHQQHLQEHVTFTILIAIEKSQHLCVIDLISQSLKLLTQQHIAYCHLLVVCCDSTLLRNSIIANEINKSITGVSNEDGKLIAGTQISIINEKSSESDTNGNWRCHKKTDTHSITYITLDDVTTTGGIPTTSLPTGRLGGIHYHDARKWREFFVHFEPFYQQCTGAAQRLVAALNDIRHADLQGLPTRRQLYAQHRALSRALMDSELHNLRKRSAATMTRLQELAKSINANPKAVNGYCSLKNKTSNVSGGGGGVGGNYYSSTLNRNKIIGSSSSSYSFNYQGNQNSKNSLNTSNNKNSHNALATSANKSSTSISASNNPLIKSSIYMPSAATSRLNANSNNNNNNNNITNATSNDVAIRLQKVSLLYNEIDRAAKRLEQLTEQRREHLRELTRQRALEDEINEVTSWITNDGSESLQRFINLELDCDTPMKEREHEFEKYYFISMKNLAKGRDLHIAASNMESLKESAINLKSALDCFAEKLESARERVEGASRLYHLLHSNSNTHDETVQAEMERLAVRFGVKGLLERCQEKEMNGIKRKPDTLNLNFSNNNGSSMQKTPPNVTSQIVTSTPHSQTQKIRPLICQRSNSYGTGSIESPSSNCQCWRDSHQMDDDIDDDDEEGQSKIADSGVGECQRCEGNPKLSRMCSCQSLNEETEKHDELDDECFEQPSKCFINIHSPLEANKHLQCFASTFELPKLEELSCLDPKIQKTLLLIMREMIGTERDYVRSLYYVIDNYVDELLRDDIPQSMRGQRNVIFGNIEKIFEFHNNHFLAELERYENNPLKVGAAFLQMESQFYLYALYNKNKPKSDTLMSEYGTAFFKSKQMELNDKMDLASYLLKPVQRMGKYALLLQQLVKACSSVQAPALQEISADVEELQKAEEMVKFQLRHGNDLLAMDSLRDCDVNVKEQGRLLRQNEFLVWQGRGGKKTLRHIFLFEELVLFSKARRFPDHKNLDLYIYKNSIKTSDIGLTAHVGDSPTKFEIWFRKRKPEDTWTLQCMSEDIKNAWTEEISKLLWQQAKRNREIRLAEMSSMGIGSKPCLDIRPSNNQINDRSITFSQLGKAPKLRHSFVGLHSEHMKASRRPNSLISESSLSSGTSSSSLSKSSTSSTASSAHQAQNQANHNQHHHHHTLHHPNNGLELINESQTLSFDNNDNPLKCHNLPHTSHTLATSYGVANSNSGSSVHIRQHHRNHNHKRSTTIVSQMSMESGIISDICVTPDQDNNDLISAWPSSNATDVHQHMQNSLIYNNNHNNNNKYLYKCHTLASKKCDSQHHHNMDYNQEQAGKEEQQQLQQYS